MIVIRWLQDWQGLEVLCWCPRDYYWTFTIYVGSINKGGLVFLRPLHGVNECGRAKICDHGIILTDECDTICWEGNPMNGIVSALALYDYISQELACTQIEWWSKTVWKWNARQKILCFSWLCLKNKIMAWDNLCRKGWEGPNQCALCKGREL